MKERLLRFGIARGAYVAIVSAALTVTAVRTFSPSPGSSGSYDPGSQTVTTPSTTSPPATAPSTTTTVGAPPSDSPRKTPPASKVATTLPGANGAAAAPGQTSAGVVTTTVATEQPRTTTTVRSTTTVPATTTTLYRPGSIVMTIPAGTKARMDRGEDVSDVLPLSVDIKVGQYIYLVNKDNYFYSYGPLNVMPMDTTPYFFSTAGNQTGYCSIARATVTFRVTN